MALSTCADCKSASSSKFAIWLLATILSNTMPSTAITTINSTDTDTIIFCLTLNRSNNPPNFLISLFSFPYILNLMVCSSYTTKKRNFPAEFFISLQKISLLFLFLMLRQKLPVFIR